MKKRIISLLLIICLIISVSPPLFTRSLGAYSPFTDVSADAWYTEYVTYVYNHSLMGGVGNGKFDPDGTLTRAQLVTVLYRIEGQPSAPTSPFADVPGGQWYTNGVAWAAANKIVSGYGGGRFGPEDPLTREQLVLILYRYAKLKGYDITASKSISAYSDVSALSDESRAAMAWGNFYGLLVANGNKIRPTDKATRAETAVAIARFDQSMQTGYYYDGAKKAYRMFPYYWLEDDAFEETCKGLSKYKGSIDEITLFCDNMHTPYMTDQMIAEYTSILTSRIKTLKSMGFKSVGINMLQTIGHGDYATDILPQSNMRTAVDAWGNTAKTQFCYRSSEFKSYIVKKYSAFAKCGADFIWVDDDFRVPDKNVTYICFCSSCISEFNSKYGVRYDRASLTNVLSAAGTDTNAQNIRRKWSEFNLAGIEDILSLIRSAVADVDPNISLGLMTVHLSANEYLLSDYSGMITALGAEKLRPGGGFHNESNTTELLTKCFGVAAQVASYNGSFDIQYELEDFPQNYNKSARIHILECTAAIMAGCNGIAFASVPPDQGNDDIMNAVAAHQDMWDDMVRVGDDWKLYGATALYPEDYGIYATNSRYLSIAGHGFYNQELIPFTYGFMPYTPYQENSEITVITEDMVCALTDAEIKTIFSKGVFMDGGAARLLIERGYSDLVGASSATWRFDDVQERYTSHTLNGNASGTLRYMYGTGLYNFTLRPGASALTVAETVTGNAAGGACSYVYENSLGGRVVVFGYMPWDYFGTWQRLEQTDNLVEWLSHGLIAARVMNDNRVSVMIKKSSDGGNIMLMATNATLDNTVNNLKIRIYGKYTGKAFVFYDETGAKKTLSASCVSYSNGYTTITLPSIAAWGFSVIYTK